MTAKPGWTLAWKGHVDLELAWLHCNNFRRANHKYAALIFFMRCLLCHRMTCPLCSRIYRNQNLWQDELTKYSVNQAYFFQVFKLIGLSNYKPQWRHGPSDQDHMPVQSQTLSVSSWPQAAQAWGEGWGDSRYKEMYGNLQWQQKNHRICHEI